MTTLTVPGFRASGVAAGIKADGALDLALITSDTPCAAAAVFTRNAFAAAPVLYDRQLLQAASTAIRAVIINSGNANACTGPQGMARAAAMARMAEEALALPQGSVFVMSTGVIGVPLPVEKIRAALPQAVTSLRPDGWEEAARAIMTTDTRPKWAYQALTGDLAPAVLLGIAKGAGMIHPNMATMLALVVTDLAVEPVALEAALTHAVNHSFNRITVDGDTSTNDTVLLLANGRRNGEGQGITNQRGRISASARDESANQRIPNPKSQIPNPQSAIRPSPFALRHSQSEIRNPKSQIPFPDSPITGPGDPRFAPFQAALTSLCTDLARQIVRDGEGATRFITVRVTGAASQEDAHRAAKAIANSPLCKTAFYGGDANWGRILAAVGYSGARVDPTRVHLWFAGGKDGRRGELIRVVASGAPIAYSEEKATHAFQQPEIDVHVELGVGDEETEVWTCDLSHEYVTINGAYRT